MMDVKSRVIDLLGYIEQVEKIKCKPAFTVPTENFAAFQHELKGLPELQFNLQTDGRRYLAPGPASAGSSTTATRSGACRLD
jgi:hypothetical protein